MNDLVTIGFSLDRYSDTPMFVQLCDGIRAHIAKGFVLEGERLPASRNLAAEIGVSRTTVVNAYEQLVAEGYLEGRRGAGYYVCPVGDIELTRTEQMSDSVEVYKETPLPYVHPSLPDMRLFPYRQWARCVSRTARLSPETLVTSNSRFGDYTLRQSIVRYLAEWRGLKVSAEQVLITAGSIDALETCIRSLVSAGDAVGLENPGYPRLRHIINSLGIPPHWLHVSEDGVEVPPASDGPVPKLLVLTPSHQFPLGGAMSQKRRLEFLHWAEQHNSWIIEDDYDSEFRYAGRPIPALASYDNNGRTIYVGTFSKVFSNDLRLGFLVMPRRLMEQFSATLAQFGPRASVSAQRSLSAFIDNGDFYRHIRRVRRVYGERQKLLINCLEKELGHLVSFNNHHAGMLVVVRLPEGSDDCLIAERVKQRGASAEALSDYYAVSTTYRGLLLGFCAFNEEEIKANIALIREEIEVG